MTDLRERLARFKEKSEAAILDDTREDFDAEAFGNEIGPYATAALLEVAEAALEVHRRYGGLLGEQCGQRIAGALSRLSTALTAAME